MFPAVNTRYSVEARRVMPGSIHILIENRVIATSELFNANELNRQRRDFSWGAVLLRRFCFPTPALYIAPTLG